MNVIYNESSFKQKYSEEGKYQIKEQSKYDSEIQKLNLRIKATEQHKKQLNIPFEPFCPKSTDSHLQHKTLQPFSSPLIKQTF